MRYMHTIFNASVWSAGGGGGGGYRSGRDASEPMDIVVAPLEIGQNRYVPAALAALIAPEGAAAPTSAASTAHSAGDEKQESSTETSVAASMAAQAARVAAQLSEVDKFRRSIRSILNKLTPEKFEVILGRVLELKVETRAMLQEVVTEYVPL